MLLAAALAVIPQAGPKDWPPLEVRSADGRHVARVDRAAGQERVPASMARFRLSVREAGPPDGGDGRELWGVLYPYDASPAHHLLASGGRAFVEVEQGFSAGRAVVAIQAGERRRAWTGDELGLPREVLGGTFQARLWLDEARPPSIAWGDGPFGPCLELEVPCRGGLSRRFDAELLELLPHDDGGDATHSPSVFPAVQGTPSERCAVPYVQSAEFPRVLRGGEPLEVELLCHHATPGWRFLGFELEQGEGSWILTPRSEAPDLVQPQVLSVFRATARIDGLPLGRHRIEVPGWLRGTDPATVDVLPRGLLASLETTGGIAGISRRVEVFEQGLARRGPGLAYEAVEGARGPTVEYVELAEPALRAVREKLDALPDAPRRARTDGAADLFHHALGVFRGGKLVWIEVDDHAATEAERAAIAALRGL